MPTWRIIFLPLLLILWYTIIWSKTLVCSAILGSEIFAILSIRCAIWPYVSPVGFTSDIVPEHWRLIYSFNPMVAVIDGFRWAIIGEQISIYWPGFLVSLLLTSAVLFSGVMYFRKTERTFADVI